MMTDTMNISLAPLEGITGYVYRNTFREMFGGCDRYYTPFLSPGPDMGLPKRAIRDAAPENNKGAELIPQILTARASDLLSCAEFFHEKGYCEINLNLGCPSGTVVAKGKGSGALSDTDKLNDFFSEVFKGFPSDMKLSVKTRIGRYQPEEFPEILAVYNQYPISELIIHPRVQKEFYKGSVHRDVFAYAVKESKIPLVYNGDLWDLEDLRKLKADFPDLQGIMMGRGLIGNPFLAADWKRELKGEPDPGAAFPNAPDEARRKKLLLFNDTLIENYLSENPDDHAALNRMKEVWDYMGACFPGEEKTLKKMKRAVKLWEFRDAVNMLR